MSPFPRTRRNGIAATICVCLALASPTLVSGCSFIFVRGPVKEAPGRYEPADCTTSRLAPWIDTFVVGAQAGVTLYALDQTDEHYQGRALSRDATIWIGVGTTVLHAVSAMYGFSTVGTCREVTPTATPYGTAPARQTRSGRRADEAAEEAAVQERMKAKAAADAKAAGEAADTGSGQTRP